MYNKARIHGNTSVAPHLFTKYTSLPQTVASGAVSIDVQPNRKLVRTDATLRHNTLTPGHATCLTRAYSTQSHARTLMAGRYNSPRGVFQPVSRRLKHTSSINMVDTTHHNSNNTQNANTLQPTGSDYQFRNRFPHVQSLYYGDVPLSPPSSSNITEYTSVLLSAFAESPLYSPSKLAYPCQLLPLSRAPIVIVSTALLQAEIDKAMQIVNQYLDYLISPHDVPLPPNYIRQHNLDTAPEYNTMDTTDKLTIHPDMDTTDATNAIVHFFEDRPSLRSLTLSTFLSAPIVTLQSLGFSALSLAHIVGFSHEDIPAPYKCIGPVLRQRFQDPQGIAIRTQLHQKQPCEEAGTKGAPTTKDLDRWYTEVAELSSNYKSSRDYRLKKAESKIRHAISSRLHTLGAELCVLVDDSVDEYETSYYNSLSSLLDKPPQPFSHYIHSLNADIDPQSVWVSLSASRQCELKAGLWMSPLTYHAYSFHHSQYQSAVDPTTLPSDERAKLYHELFSHPDMAQRVPPDDLTAHVHHMNALQQGMEGISSGSIDHQLVKAVLSTSHEGQISASILQQHKPGKGVVREKRREKRWERQHAHEQVIQDRIERQHEEMKQLGYYDDDVDDNDNDSDDDDHNHSRKNPHDEDPSSSVQASISTTTTESHPKLWNLIDTSILDLNEPTAVTAKDEDSDHPIKNPNQTPHHDSTRRSSSDSDRFETDNDSPSHDAYLKNSGETSSDSDPDIFESDSIDTILRAAALKSSQNQGGDQFTHAEFVEPVDYDTIHSLRAQIDDHVYGEFGPLVNVDFVHGLARKKRLTGNFNHHSPLIQAVLGARNASSGRPKYITQHQDDTNTLPFWEQLEFEQEQEENESKLTLQTEIIPQHTKQQMEQELEEKKLAARQAHFQRQEDARLRRQRELFDRIQRLVAESKTSTVANSGDGQPIAPLDTDEDDHRAIQIVSIGDEKRIIGETGAFSITKVTRQDQEPQEQITKIIRVFDATGGFGTDSFMLASTVNQNKEIKLEITMMENDRTMFTLLCDGVRRAQQVRYDPTKPQQSNQDPELETAVSQLSRSTYFNHANTSTLDQENDPERQRILDLAEKTLAGYIEGGMGEDKGVESLSKSPEAIRIAQMAKQHRSEVHTIANRLDVVCGNSVEFLTRLQYCPPSLLDTYRSHFTQKLSEIQQYLHKSFDINLTSHPALEALATVHVSSPYRKNITLGQEASPSTVDSPLHPSHITTTPLAKQFDAHPSLSPIILPHEQHLRDHVKQNSIKPLPFAKRAYDIIYLDPFYPVKHSGKYAKQKTISRNTKLMVLAKKLYEIAETRQLATASQLLASTSNDDHDSQASLSTYTNQQGESMAQSLQTPKSLPIPYPILNTREIFTIHQFAAELLSHFIELMADGEISAQKVHEQLQQCLHGVLTLQPSLYPVFVSFIIPFVKHKYPTQHQLPFMPDAIHGVQEPLNTDLLLNMARLNAIERVVLKRPNHARVRFKHQTTSYLDKNTRFDSTTVLGVTKDGTRNLLKTMSILSQTNLLDTFQSNQSHGASASLPEHSSSKKKVRTGHKKVVHAKKKKSRRYK